jgi:hypothetical protein
MVTRILDIREKSIAHFGILVPAIHGVDSFSQLGAALFVYAASVDPGVRQAVPFSQAATISDFVIACLSLSIAGLHVL